MRSCRIDHERLFAFVDGLEDGLDEHVMTCDECQAFLADLWAGELKTDLSVPVVQRLKLEQFLIDLAKLGFGIAGRMGRAGMLYGLGTEAAASTVEHGAEPPTPR